MCKFLEQVGRSDIEVGIGIETEVQRERMYHEGWAGSYDLNAYAGRLSRDGVDRLIDIVMASDEEVIIMCIGPLVNIAKAAQREKKIVQKSRIVGMLGSLRSGWFEGTPPVSEYNIICSTGSAKVVLQKWRGKGKIVLTPLDTCGRIVLNGPLYQEWKQAASAGNSKVSLAILQNFEEWAAHRKPKPYKSGEAVLEDASSTLFDTVAVHLGYSTEFLKMEEIHVKIENDGKLTEFAEANDETSPVLFATEWTDMPGFSRFMVDRLLSM